MGTAVSFSGSGSSAPTGQTLSYAWNFGDSSAATGASPTHTYSAAGSFTVTLTVTASGGGTATSTAMVTITAVPVPVAVAGGPYTGVVGTAVSFSGSGSTAPTGQTLSYAWNFGDSSTGTGVGPAHTYTTAGSFTVTLTVTASGGGTATSTGMVTITAVPVPVANAGGPYTGVVGTAVSFSGSGSTAPTGQTLSYAWNFGDSSTGTGVSPTHTYTTAGSFTVTLTVTASGGGTATSTAMVTVTAVPVPVASAGGPYTGVVGTAVSFSGSASTAPTGQTLSYAWNFGDSSKGTGVSPTHTYTTAGSFTVTLTVTASGGGMATSTAAVSVTAVQVPVANAGGPYTGVVGTAVSFSGSGSTAPAGQTLSYAWNFGDSSTGTGASPTHTYTGAGSFTVTLTVTASGGGTATSTAMVTVTAVPVPVAVAGGPYTGVVGTAVSFSGAGSTAPTGQTLSYAWNFGDSSTGTGVSPTHTYTTAGSFTVTLTVTASGGGTATSTGMVTITAVPVPVANAGGPYTGVVGTAVSFSGSASTAPTGQTLSYAWNFGDSSTGTGVSPTHTYTTAGSFTVTLTVTASGGGTATSTAMVTITAVPVPVASAGGPYTGVVGTAVSFSGAGSTAPTGQTLSYAWNFGDSSTGTGVSPTHTYTTAGSFIVTLTVTASGGGTATSTAAVTVTAAPAPTISSFSPASGPIGTVVTISGSNLSSGTVPQVTLAQQGGSTLSAPVSASTANSLSFVIPPGAATGPISLMVGTQSISSISPLTVTTSSTFTVSVTPGTGTLIQGQSAALAVTVNSTNGFTGLAALTVAGVPTGVTASFQPSSVTSGQVSVLSLTAPSSQAVATSTLTISAAAVVDGQSLSQSATASLKVTAVSTSFLGRTVVDDATNTPIGGVTIKFLGVTDKGNATGCTGQTISDGAGNFLLSNLPTACIGPQLISYDGTTATSPAGKYAGVNLSYTLVSGQVVSSPVLVHLPRIDNAETVQVQQNATTDQVFTFSTIPGLQVTVYAGTTISLADGTQPNPFPLAAMDIPLDRLPEQTPTNGMLMNFVVAFQPANATASQPVAVVFPNPLNVAPGTGAALTTLDPTRGYMVPYGTTTVANDGRTFIPDLDPAHPGHRYGLVHFDWHTPLGQLIDAFLIGLEHCFTCNPVDIATGVETYTTTDLQVRGGRGSMEIQRTYRTLSANAGPFGIGTGFNYSMQLNLTNYLKIAGPLQIITPNGNQYTMSPAPDGSLVNTTIPVLRGAVLRPNVATGTYTLRQLDGTLYTFQTFASQGSFGAYLTLITDLNGNTTTLTLNPAQPLQVLAVTDPVGRSMFLSYDNSNRITQVADPIGRVVKYTYNSQGTLATFTDANGGVSKYTYDSHNSVLTITDPRGVITETNTYNSSGDGRVMQQVDANGGVTKFAYTLLNPTAALLYVTVSGYSPVLQTVVTNPLGNSTIYRFNPAGFLLSATDPSGQTTTLTHDTTHNNLVTGYQGAGVCAICGDRTQGDTSYTYDQAGNKLTQTDGMGNVTILTYDYRFNKINSITDPLGNKTTINYDPAGNPVSVTDANSHIVRTTYDAFGEPVQTTDPTGAITNLSYDSFGNVTAITNAVGNVTHLTHDAVSRLTQVSDALGRTGHAAFDSLDRVVLLIDPRGNKTQFSYDAIGGLLSIVDAKGGVIQITYDLLERPASRTSALNKTQLYTYDANSNLVSFTDRRNQLSRFVYDVMNRLITATYQDSTVAKTYDSRGRLLGVIDSMDGNFQYTYNSAGLLLSQSGPTGVVQYQRDALERTSFEQVVGQAKTSYIYDLVGNLISASNPELGITYAYDPRNLPLSLSRTNGVTTTYSYDNLGQLLTLTDSVSNGVLNTQTFAYDEVGKRTIEKGGISQALTTQSQMHTVDSASELSSAGLTIYAYDANGNRLKAITGSETETYLWDSRNRLSSISDTISGSTFMHYDGAINLLGVDKTASGNTSFVIDEVTNPVLVSQGGNLSILSGRSVDSEYGSTDNANNVFFAIRDTRGSVLALTDATGVLSSPRYYEPFGQTTAPSNLVYPFAYAGRIPITAELYYNRARYYSATAGSFISEDPSGPGNDGNLYEYAGDDPINSVDPYGLWRWPDYYSASVSGGVSKPPWLKWLSFSGSVSVDKYGDVFFGGALGKDALTGGRPLGGSATVNWIDSACDSDLSRDKLQSFLSGLSGTASAGYWAGVTETYSPNSDGAHFSTGIGFVTPGVGVSGGYSSSGWNPGDSITRSIQQQYGNAPYYGYAPMTIDQAFHGGK